MAESWKLTDTVHPDRKNVFCVDPGSERQVCTLVSGSHRKLDQFRIDARLIARSPDLKAFIGWVVGQAAGQHSDPLETLRHIEEQARAFLAQVDA